ncbi:hypothetical protein SAMN05216489_01762 [Streptomyces sp. 3213]|nr:hypothetical protein SAMN05216489_01762 [Streptomyces sp. 3213] [Streptomyces sp. 3213.3]
MSYGERQPPESPRAVRGRDGRRRRGWGWGSWFLQRSIRWANARGPVAVRTAAIGMRHQQGCVQAGLGTTDDDRDNEPAAGFEHACLSRFLAAWLRGAWVGHPRIAGRTGVPVVAESPPHLSVDPKTRRTPMCDQRPEIARQRLQPEGCITSRGMSRATFFCSFPTKEDVLLVITEDHARHAQDALERRPEDEPIRTALRHALEPADRQGKDRGAALRTARPRPLSSPAPSAASTRPSRPGSSATARVCCRSFWTGPWVRCTRSPRSPAPPAARLDARGSRVLPVPGPETLHHR